MNTNPWASQDVTALMSEVSLNTIEALGSTGPAFKPPAAKFCSQASAVMRGTSSRTAPQMQVTYYFITLLTTFLWLSHANDTNCFLCSWESKRNSCAWCEVQAIVQRTGFETFPGDCNPQHARFSWDVLNTSFSTSILCGHEYVGKFIVDLYIFTDIKPCKHQSRHCIGHAFWGNYPWPHTAFVLLSRNQNPHWNRPHA